MAPSKATRAAKAAKATKAAEPEPNELEELKQQNAQLQKQLDVGPMSAPTGQKAINSWVDRRIIESPGNSSVIIDR